SPTDLFYWESVLSDIRGIVARLREPLDRVGAGNEEARYWFAALESRIEIVLNDLYALAPWLAPPLEEDVRLASSTLPEILALLCHIPKIRELPAHIREISGAIGRRLEDPRPLCAAPRAVLERLRAELPAAEANAWRLLRDCDSQAGVASRWID